MPYDFFVWGYVQDLVYAIPNLLTEITLWSASEMHLVLPPHTYEM